MGQSKYGAVRTEVDGITFASKKEAKRYGELKLLEKAGEIRKLTLQPRYPLYAGPMPESPMVILRLVGEYRADFEYETEALPRLWLKKTEDVKGVRTETYRLKKKLFEAQYCREVHEV
jgi:hypothetical protein